MYMNNSDIFSSCSRKFAMVYSTGKDCTLALHRMLEQGNELVCLIIGVHCVSKLSYMHAVRLEILRQYEKAFGVPIVFMESHYKYDDNAAIKALEQVKLLGAEAVCTGDIDFEYSKQWNKKCAEQSGLKGIYPLWHNDKEEILKGLFDGGYKCIVKSVRSDLGMSDVLGKPLDHEIIERFRQKGADICGENGEFHTMAVDGACFKSPIKYGIGSVKTSNGYDIIDIRFPLG